MTSQLILRAPLARRSFPLCLLQLQCSALLLVGCQNERSERGGGAAPGQPAPQPQASSTTVESARPSPAAPGAPQSHARGPLNVILVTVEAWSTDAPGFTGEEQQLLPQLSRWAAESVLWENHRAVSSHTPQSLAALSSGRMPSTLHRDGAFFPTYAEENVFLAEVLQAKGIRTLAVQSDPQLARGKGFEQGFDVWESPSAGGDGAEPASERATARLMALLAEPSNTTRQFFAWLHLDDGRDPRPRATTPARSTASARERHRAELQRVDAALGKLLESARQQPWWARTALIATGNRGESYGEQGAAQRGRELAEVLLKTPLIIQAPGAAPARLAAARSQLDLAPTIVELMGLPPYEQHQGQSLLPELYGALAPERQVLLFELCEDVENAGLRAMLVGDEKLVVPAHRDEERLFNLKEDPGETKNLAEAQPARFRALAVRFEGEWRKVPSVEPYGGMKLRSGRLAEGRPGPSPSQR